MSQYRRNMKYSTANCLRRKSEWAALLDDQNADSCETIVFVCSSHSSWAETVVFVGSNTRGSWRRCILMTSDESVRASLAAVISLPVGGEVLRWACQSVCPSVRVSRKPHVQISPYFLYMLPVAVTRSFSDANAYFRFSGWRSCFHIIERMTRIKDDWKIGRRRRRIIL